MSVEKKSFIKVDDLMSKVSLEQAVGAETRTRCFLARGKTQETGDRALAIQTEHPAKQWRCRRNGCGKSGNLVLLSN